MGNVADDILATLHVDESTITYTDLPATFDTHFAACNNIILARVEFNRKVQKPREAIDTFIQALHRLAEDCDYGALKDVLIRARTVVGVADDDLSDDLQTRANLTLADAFKSLVRPTPARKGKNSFAAKLTF